MNGVSIRGNVMTITYTPTDEEDKKACELIPTNRFLLLNFMNMYTLTNPTFLNGEFETTAHFDGTVLTVNHKKVK